MFCFLFSALTHYFWFNCLNTSNGIKIYSNVHVPEQLAADPRPPLENGANSSLQKNKINTFLVFG